MKYSVVIEELVSDTFEVEAKSEEEALDFARKEYRRGNFVLEPGELQSTKVAVCREDGLSEFCEIF